MAKNREEQDYVSKGVPGNAAPEGELFGAPPLAPTPLPPVFPPPDTDVEPESVESAFARLEQPPPTPNTDPVLLPEPGVTTIAKAGDTALVGDVTLSEGTAISLSQAGQDIAIANAGVVSVVEDDATVTGAWQLVVTQNLTIETAGQETIITGPDLSSYLTSEADTLDTVCDRGAATDKTITSTHQGGYSFIADGEASAEGGGSMLFKGEHDDYALAKQDQPGDTTDFELWLRTGPVKLYSYDKSAAKHTFHSPADVDVDGTLKAGAYQSSDGSAGISTWFDDGANFRVTVKDGLITAVGNSQGGGHG